MSEITMSQVLELNDPKLLKIALRIVREAELAAEKVAANFTHAPTYPISADQKTLENVLKTRFSMMPDQIKQAASVKAVTRMNVSAEARKKRFGDFAAVDLKSQISVDDQVKAILFPAALKFTASEITSITQLHAPIALAASAPAITSAATASAATPAAAAGVNKLELRIHKVKCVDETGGWFAERLGDDEIDLGGTSVDETGDTKHIPKFRVSSSFDDGESKVYAPPRQFTYFSLLEGASFPKYYIVTLVLSEADMGGLPNFINALFDLIKSKVKDAITLAGFPTGPALGALIGNAVAYIVNRIFGILHSIWSDDIFPPVSVAVKIPSLSTRWNGRTDSPEQVVSFIGHGGDYQLTYDWRLFA